MKFNEDQLWDGMTVDEVKDLMESLHLVAAPNELWDGMTKSEVKGALSVAEIQMTRTPKEGQ